jgi:Retrotransposon gag protein
MAGNHQNELQQQLQAAQQRIQALNDQTAQANAEIARLRALTPQARSFSSSLPPPPIRPPGLSIQTTQHVGSSSHQTNNVRSTAPSSTFVFPTIPATLPSISTMPPIFTNPFSGPPVFTYVSNPSTSMPTSSIPFPSMPIPTMPTGTLPTQHIPTQAIPNMQTFFHTQNEATSSAHQNRAQLDDPVNARLKMLEEQNEKVLSLLAKLPGAAVPVEVEPKTGYQASPYVDEIALVDVPKKYNLPAFTSKYTGVTDPVEHVAQYKQLMWTASIPSQYQEVCMCKSFGSTLSGAALQWLINLKPKSIGSFAELVNQFTRQFASSRKMEKQTSDLYYIVQKPGETIREYFNRFNAAMIEVKDCDIKTAIEAYKRGLEDSSGLYTELTKYPPENFDDVRARTLAYMRIEDDALFRRKQSNDKKPLGVQKHDFKPKRVNKIGNPQKESRARTNKGSGKFRYPELSTYNFAGTSKDLVESLRKLDVNVRWPKKPEMPSKDKDQSRWCDYHEDHGHTTDECISLKKEVSYLKSKGHLKSVIPDDPERPASPIHTKVVNCITGGSEVCGLTYSAAKRHA